MSLRKGRLFPSPFQVLDSDGSGGLDSDEFCAAIRKLVLLYVPIRPPPYRMVLLYFGFLATVSCLTA